MQVRLENVTKKFPGVTAVNTFSVTLPDGELICLLRLRQIHHSQYAFGHPARVRRRYLL